MSIAAGRVPAESAHETLIVGGGEEGWMDWAVVRREFGHVYIAVVVAVDVDVRVVRRDATCAERVARLR